MRRNLFIAMFREKARFIGLMSVLIVAILMSGFAVRVVPFSAPVTSGDLMMFKDLLEGNKVDYSPYPIGYFALIAMIIRITGFSGMLVFQAFIYILTAVMVYLTLDCLRVRPLLSMSAVAVALLHPSVFTGVTKLTETAMAIFLMVMLCFWLAYTKRRRMTVFMAFCGGLLIGWLVLIRPSNISLCPLMVLSIVWSERDFFRRVMSGIVLFTVSALMVMNVNYYFKNRWIPLEPYYGAYALHNGVNRYAAEYILRDYHGEWSTKVAFAAEGIKIPDFNAVIIPNLSKIYIESSLRWIRNQPVEYLKLQVIKFFVFFRPDWRSLPKFKSFYLKLAVMLSQTFLVFVSFFWFWLRWHYRQESKLLDGIAAPLILILYFLPYWLTTIDPRYRTAIDLVLLIDIVRLVDQSVLEKYGVL